MLLHQGRQLGPLPGLQNMKRPAGLEGRGVCCAFCNRSEHVTLQECLVGDIFPGQHALAKPRGGWQCSH